MARIRIRALVASIALSTLLAAPMPLFLGAAAQEATPAAGDGGQGSVLLFAAPGMRSDLVETFAAEGALPAINDMQAAGASTDSGLLAPFPATIGSTLPTLLSGTWPAEHGIVSDTFFRTGSPDFSDVATWSDPGLLQADTLPQAAERAGKQVVSVGWNGISGLDPALAGPVVGEPVP